MMDTEGVNEWKMMDTEEVRECNKYTRRHVKRLCVQIAGGISMSGEKNFFATPLPARYRSLARLPNFHNL